MTVVSSKTVQLMAGHNRERKRKGLRSHIPFKDTPQLPKDLLLAPTS
jgi:hypothetical protein